ncbi:hypothetical protein BS78_03G246400 [Paspalum vaginatum]|nr:hypothetical protein BS78_03G246400 [Paspalum vaginatum]
MTMVLRFNVESHEAIILSPVTLVRHLRLKVSNPPGTVRSDSRGVRRLYYWRASTRILRGLQAWRLRWRHYLCLWRRKIQMLRSLCTHSYEHLLTSRCIYFIRVARKLRSCSWDIRSQVVVYTISYYGHPTILE